MSTESIKISQLPAYPGTASTGDIPYSYNGRTYRISPNKLGVSGSTTDYFTVATAGTTATFSDLIGKTIAGPILRGGLGTGRLITSGTPTGNQIKFVSATGTFTVSVDVPFIGGEELTITYI